MEDHPPKNKRQKPGADCGCPREWLANVYDSYAGGLYRYALMILADPAAAEDAVHQVFGKLAAMQRRAGEISSCNGYLRTAVRNECYRVIRQRQSAELPVNCSGTMLSAVDEHKADARDLQQAIEQALRALPPDQREVIHMKVYENMTFQQISEALAISINTAASRYRYAIEKLQRKLRPYCQAED